MRVRPVGPHFFGLVIGAAYWWKVECNISQSCRESVSLDRRVWGRISVCRMGIGKVDKGLLFGWSSHR